jgi:hypothetical protein
MNSGLLHLEQEKTYIVHFLRVWIIIDNEQKNVLVSDCVSKSFSVQLLHINIK